MIFKTLSAKASCSLFLALCAFQSNATEIDFALSDNAVYGAISVTPKNSEAQFGFGYLYNESGRNAYHLDIHAQGQTVLGNMPTTAGIGFRAIGYKEHSNEGYGGGLGGFGEIKIPEVPGLTARTSFHYAPSILTSGDADNFKWFNLGASYRFIRSADIQAGYRYIKAALDNRPNRTIESGLYIGFRMNF